jgi:hypothetical protein
MVAFLKLFHHSVLVLQLQLCPPYEDLDGLGAGDTSGATGDVLGDDAEGAQGGVLATVVLHSHVGAVSIKVIVLPIKGDVVTASVDGTGAVAHKLGALPASFLADTGIVAVQLDPVPREV